MEIGKHSRKLVELRKALRQGTLTSDGLLPIEGPTLLEEARRSEIEIVDVFRTPVRKVSRKQSGLCAPGELRWSALRPPPRQQLRNGSGKVPQPSWSAMRARVSLRKKLHNVIPCCGFRRTRPLIR